MIDNAHVIEGGRLLREDGRAQIETSALWSTDGDARAQLWDVVDRMRELISFEHLQRYGQGFGFRLEDLFDARILARTEAEGAEAVRQLRRVLSASASITVEPTPLLPDGAAIAVAARFAEPNGVRARNHYRIEGTRVRVEAFELHVVEHCNLSCAHCCNMSPYLDEHTMTVEEIDAQCREMATHLKADVFKIMGGEPLLHPNISEVLRVIRKSGISDVVRLFTNGLLLHRMDDDFWRALDQITISDYSSAPVKPALLERYREKAREFDVVLNVKPVDRFSQVMSSTRVDEDEKVQATYDACWLRDRCLIVRGGAFFKCTRAAYFHEFQTRIEVDRPEPASAEIVRKDGVSLEGPDFQVRLLEHLNAKTPMGACRYCQGSSGQMVPHTQLTKLDVRRGRL